MLKMAGLLFFLAGSTVFLGITTAEIFYPPGYSISQSMISTLGASSPPDSVIKEPSAAIFDGIMLAAGLMIMVGSLLIKRAFPKKIVSALFLMGLGAFGVGVFPAFHPLAHPISALVAFGAGGVAALFSARVTSSPFSYLALILGLVALVFLFFGIFLTSLIVPILGAGGTERWVAYPIMIWLLGFGGYLMNSNKKV